LGHFLHDLQGQVAALNANVDFLAKLGPGSVDKRRPEFMESIEDVRTVFAQLMSNVRTVQDYDRYETGQLVLQEGTFALGDVAGEVAHELRRHALAADKSLTLSRPALESERRLSGDRDLVHRAMLNLGMSALRRAATRAEVSLSIAETDEGSRCRAFAGQESPQPASATLRAVRAAGHAVRRVWAGPGAGARGRRAARRAHLGRDRAGGGCVFVFELGWRRRGLRGKRPSEARRGRTDRRSMRAPPAAGVSPLLFWIVAVARRRAPAPPAKVDELCKALLEDANYKVRVQAALVLGRLGDTASVPSLLKALGDSNKTVRAIAAQALGQLADQGAVEALRQLLGRENDPFVRTQTEKALAALAGGGKRARIYLNFGPFTGGVKAASGEAARLIHDALARELGKLQVVTLSLSAVDQKNFVRTGLLGFYIDGNITRLDDTQSGGGSETSCDVKVMVARWPSRSIIMWTNAGASLQSGSRPRDKEDARRECLEASAGQLAEDLGKFFKAQGG
jgi:hypothetical protein